MSHYQEIIQEATNETDLKVIQQIEDIMRDDIFHSTLDWQTREQLIAAAIQAKGIRRKLKRMGFIQ